MGGKVPFTDANLKTWQKGGLCTAGLFLVLSVALREVSRVWWYQETIWFKALVALNYPAAELGRVFLNRVGIPRIYDAPVSWRETLVINLTAFTFGTIWWFLLGALGSVVWLWLEKFLGSES